jgi:hypothetical protein
MCDYNLNTQAETKAWLLQNHPDRGGQVDNAIVQEVVDCYKIREYCGEDDESLQSEPETSESDSERQSASPEGVEEAQPLAQPLTVKIYTCMRQLENWSKILPEHKIDSPQFNPAAVKAAIQNASPKLEQLFRIIQQVDENDFNTYGTYFKHFIFSDVKEEGYGAKILASAFIANGYKNLISARDVPGQKALKLTLRTPGAGEEGKGFGLLSSSTIFNSEFSQKFKKEVLTMYNKRPDNIHGDQMRFIILDSGFKEGIDLFDVKYVHIYEPSMTVADLKQTVGRATRTCGQKGLHFEPNVGWPLYVYNYYAVVPEIMKERYKAADRTLLTNPDDDEYIFKNTTKFKDAILLYSKYDRTLTNLAEQLYKLAPVLAVDYDLTRNIHKIDDIAYLYSHYVDADASDSSLAGGAQGDQINCGGKCGARSTKEVPASVKFLVAVYTKYGHPKERLPAKNMRAYLCAYMRSNPIYCRQLNEEWSNRVGMIPALMAKKMRTNTAKEASLSPASLSPAPASLSPASLSPASLSPASLSPASLSPASLSPMQTVKKISRKITVKSKKTNKSPANSPANSSANSSANSRANKTVKNKKVYSWVKELTDADLERYIQFIGIPVEKQPEDRADRERLYIDLLKDFILDKEPQVERAEPQVEPPNVKPQEVESIHDSIKSVKNYLTQKQLDELDAALSAAEPSAPVPSAAEPSAPEELAVPSEAVPSAAEPSAAEELAVPASAAVPSAAEPSAPVAVNAKYTWMNNMTNAGLTRHIEFMGVLKSRQPTSRAEKEKLYIKLLTKVSGRPKQSTKKVRPTYKNKTIKNKLSALQEQEEPAPEEVKENKTLSIANGIMQQLDIVPYKDETVATNLELLKYRGKVLKEFKEGTPKPPSKKLNFTKMRDFIKTNFSKDFTWDPIILENKCVEPPASPRASLRSPTSPASPTSLRASPTSPTSPIVSPTSPIVSPTSPTSPNLSPLESPSPAHLKMRRTVIQKYINEMENQPAASMSATASIASIPSASIPSASMSASIPSASIPSASIPSASIASMSPANSQTGGSRVLKLNNTQNFIKTFFTPKSPYKGLLLWHSVGTGKTCTAIATATATFDLEGYTILWVTRNTLKGDVYKNMFDDVCHAVLAEKMKKEGLVIPTDTAKRNRLIGSNWIEPISYKTFSNLLTLGKHNKYLERLIARNGKSDILRKTLIIIDEAHKLYGGDLKAAERPDMKVMEKLLQKSYLKSGKDSARVLLMTATPFTNSPMELFKLINLCKSNEEEYIPTDINTFKTAYMGSDNFFTQAGVQKIADKLSGYISYLNREQDPTQFAQPIMIDVPVILSHIEDDALRTYYLANDNKSEKQQQAEDPAIEATKQQIRAYQAELKELKAALRANKKTFKEVLKTRVAQCKPIKEKAERRQCVGELEAEVEAEELAEETKIREDIGALVDLIAETEAENRTLINAIKGYKKKMVELKDGLLQEVMLNERCKNIKSA